jgi:outer membrane murein-binding lipoprotein Lpp
MPSPHKGLFLEAGVLMLAAMVLSVCCTERASAQVSSDQVQQLQMKLSQMEKEMQELKQQISSIQQQSPQKPLATPDKAEEALQEAVSDQASAHVPLEQVGNAPLPPEGGTTLDFYGFAMLDSGYDFATNNPDWFDVVRPTKLNAAPGEFGPDGKVYFGVRQTRFGVKTATETPLGQLNTRFEFELFGTGVDAGQTTFRLRHAWGELAAIGAGQTWSPFMDIDVFPNTIEYWGPNGMVFYRNVQVRWMPLRGRTQVSIAAERPGATADQGQYSDFIELQNVKPHFTLPDFTGHVRFDRDWGHLQIAGIFRKISWVDTNPAQPNLSGTFYGWGVNVSSNLKFNTNNIGKFSVVYGSGIENYMNDAPVDVGVQSNPSNPTAPKRGVTLPVLGVVSFLDHNWSPRFTTSAGYSMVNIQNPNGDLADAFHQGHYAIGNLLFYPVKQVMMGTEFQFGRRVNFADGFNTNDYRLQFSFRYDWAKAFGIDR